MNIKAQKTAIEINSDCSFF